MEQEEQEPNNSSEIGAKGTLFIIGGGSRPDAMMKELCVVSLPGVKSYAIVLTQASGEPDSAYYYLNLQFVEHTRRPILHVDSLRLLTFPIDSIENADLIFISGGDQNRFMSAVSAKAKSAITDAYRKGATIAGTSAGAALMSKVMITGDQRLESEYESTYSHLKYGNGIYAEGLGLVDSMIVDQHFVRRSRYNRLISAMADTGFPLAIGIEESTALVLSPHTGRVVGDAQVLIFRAPANITRFGDQIGFKNLVIHAYLPGDTLSLDHL